jgi:beta-galactosidase GanA
MNPRKMGVVVCVVVLMCLGAGGAVGLRGKVSTSERLNVLRESEDPPSRNEGRAPAGSHARLADLKIGHCTKSGPPQKAVPTRGEEGFLPVAVWYSGGKARAPMLETVTAESAVAWKKDLETIRGLGFNTVKTWVEWNVGEPREGEYHLENLDLLLKLAEETGLKVIVQMYVDSAPEWVGTKYPEGRYAAQDGQGIPSQAAPGFCFDNANVRKAVLGFFQEVACHAEKSSAFYAWDLWSEPATLNWARIGYKAEPMFCYCPASQERFREWLQKKYGLLEKLNVAWHRTFTEWKQVEPPRFGTILTYTDFMDWRVFYGYKLAEDLKMRSDAVKAVDPGHPTTSHAPNPSPLVRTLADPYDPTDDYLMKNSVDYFGTSFYPKLTAVEYNWSLNRRVLAMDLTASMTGGRGFFVGELQSGFGVRGTTIGSEVTPSDLEMWTWGMISRGARAICYYAFYPMNAGYESGGYGMIQLDGTLTERSKRAGETAKKIAANADLLVNTKPKQAEVAIVFSPLVPLLGGYDEENSRNAIHRAVAGYHRMFFERNVAVEVVSSRELAGADLSKYKLMILPYPLMMTVDEAGALKEYVHAGGHLFVEARPGWVNEEGHAEGAVPGFGWTEIFGVRETSIEPGRAFAVKWGTQSFAGMSFRERFAELDGKAKVVARFEDGSPAAYEHAFGKGSAILLGTFAGEENEKKPASMNALGGILAQWAGVKAPDLKAAGKIELREMAGDKGKVVFLFNHGGKGAEVSFEEELEKPAVSVKEIVQDKEIGMRGKRFSMEAVVPGESVRIWRIDY